MNNRLERLHRVKLVHSKHGWLVSGATLLIIGAGLNINSVKADTIDPAAKVTTIQDTVRAESAAPTNSQASSAVSSQATTSQQTSATSAQASSAAAPKYTASQQATIDKASAAVTQDKANIASNQAATSQAQSVATSQAATVKSDQAAVSQASQAVSQAKSTQAADQKKADSLAPQDYKAAESVVTKTSQAASSAQTKVNTASTAVTKATSAASKASASLDAAKSVQSKASNTLASAQTTLNNTSKTTTIHHDPTPVQPGTYNDGTEISSVNQLPTVMVKPSDADKYADAGDYMENSWYEYAGTDQTDTSSKIINGKLTVAQQAEAAQYAMTLINNLRAQNGLKPIVVSPAAQQLAQNDANLRNQYKINNFAHTSPSVAVGIIPQADWTKNMLGSIDPSYGTYEDALDDPANYSYDESQNMALLFFAPTTMLQLKVNILQALTEMYYADGAENNWGHKKALLQTALGDNTFDNLYMGLNVMAPDADGHSNVLFDFFSTWDTANGITAKINTALQANPVSQYVATGYNTTTTNPAYATAQKAVTSAQASYNSATAAVTKAAQTLATATTNKAKAQASLTSAQAQLTKANSDLNLANAALQQAKDKYGKQLDAYNAAMKVVSQDKAAVSQLNNKLNDAKNLLNKDTENLAGTKAKIAGLKSELVKLNSKLVEDEKALKDALNPETTPDKNKGGNATTDKDGSKDTASNTSGKANTGKNKDTTKPNSSNTTNKNSNKNSGTTTNSKSNTNVATDTKKEVQKNNSNGNISAIKSAKNTGKTDTSAEHPIDSSNKAYKSTTSIVDSNKQSNETARSIKPATQAEPKDMSSHSTNTYTAVKNSNTPSAKPVYPTRAEYKVEQANKNNSNTRNSSATLPQTNEQTNTNVSAIIGLIIATLSLGLFGYKRKH